MQPLQYLTDSAGNRIAVVIPISEWNSILCKYADLRLLEQESPKEKQVSTQYLMGDFSGTLEQAAVDTLLKHLEQSRW